MGLCNTFLLLKIEEHAGVRLDRQTLSKLWDDLAIELNELGPPTSTPAMWRKRWSNYKCEKVRSERKARSRSAGNDSKERAAPSTSRKNDRYEKPNDTKLSESSEAFLNVSFGEEVKHFFPSTAHRTNLIKTFNLYWLGQPSILPCGAQCTEVHPKIFQSEVLRKLDAIITQQGDMIKHQRQLIEQQKKLNILLEETLSKNK